MVAYSPLGNSHRHLAGPKVLEDRMLSKIGILYDKSSIQVALRYQVFFQHLFFLQCSRYFVFTFESRQVLGIQCLQSLNDNNLFLQVQRGIPVIPNSINYTQIQANFNIFDFQLKYDEMALIDSIDNSTDAKKSFRIHHRNGSFSHSPYYPFHEEF